MLFTITHLTATTCVLHCEQLRVACLAQQHNDKLDGVGFEPPTLCSLDSPMYFLSHSRDLCSARLIDRQRPEGELREWAL